MDKYWEIVRLEDGSFVLQSSEDSSEPLVKIEFSEAAEDLLQDQIEEVAQAMIGAGVQAANFIEDSMVDEALPNEETVVH